MVARKSMESQAEDPFTERILRSTTGVLQGCPGRGPFQWLGFGIKLTDACYRRPIVLCPVRRYLGVSDSNWLESEANPGCHRERHGKPDRLTPIM